MNKNKFYKAWAIITTLLLLFAIGSTAVLAALYGDVNGDGEVNILDILCVRDAIFGGAGLSPKARQNLYMEETDNPNVDHILLIRDAIFGAEP